MRYAPLRGVNASHSVPMKASTNSRGKQFAITIASRQWAKSVSRSNNPSKIINIILRDKDHESGTSNPDHSTPVDTVGNSVRARSRIFLQSKEVIKLGLIKSPADVIKSMLDKSKNIFMLVMSRAFVACLENGSPVFAKSSSRVMFIIQRVSLFICDSTERQHRFLVAPGTLSTPASC